MRPELRSLAKEGHSGYVFYGDGSKKSQARNWIDGRMRRITELLRRTDSLAVRSEFDLTKFE
jgi:hypothetical protein